MREKTPIISRTSKYPNVYWEKHKQKWQAQKMRKYEKFNLGTYDTPEEAYIAVLEWEKEHPPLDRSKWAQGAKAWGKSKYKGVTLHRYGRLRKWRAECKYRGERYRLGYYETEEEAARAYDKKQLELRGPTAKLNFPEDQSC